MASDQPSDVDRISKDVADIMAGLSGIRNHVASLQATVKGLERRAKQSARANGRRRQGGGQRKPTGFARPVRVSSQLSEFMGRAPGELVARTEATRAVNAYIKERSLQDPENARRIVPDAKLRELLFGSGEEKGEDLTYFNLQRYMNPHFVVEASPACQHSHE